MNWFLILYLIGFVKNCISSVYEDDGVSIEDEDPVFESKTSNYDKFIKKHQDLSNRIKRDTDNFLNSYIKNLKDVNF